jgi:hypothetical protein
MFSKDFYNQLWIAAEIWFIARTQYISLRNLAVEYRANDIITGKEEMDDIFFALTLCNTKHFL